MKGKGKRKIEMKKVQDARGRHAAFSRRRLGIYKKAMELTTLCGARVGILIFSRPDRPYTYGHSSFEEVAKRFLVQNFNNLDESDACFVLNDDQKVKIDNLLKDYEALIDQLEFEKAREKSMEGNCSYNGWWNTPIEELNEDELIKRLKSFKDLKSQLHNLAVGKGTSAPSFPKTLIDLNKPPPMDKGNEIASSSSSNVNDDK